MVIRIGGKVCNSWHIVDTSNMVTTILLHCVTPDAQDITMSKNHQRFEIEKNFFNIRT